MPTVTLPDGSQRTFEQPLSVYDVAADIGAGLAKAALLASSTAVRSTRRIGLKKMWRSVLSLIGMMRD